MVLDVLTSLCLCRVTPEPLPSSGAVLNGLVVSITFRTAYKSWPFKKILQEVFSLISGLLRQPLVPTQTHDNRWKEVELDVKREDTQTPLRREDVTKVVETAQTHQTHPIK